jgi:hypothetical protein
VFTFPLIDVLLIEKLTEELQYKTTDLVAAGKDTLRLSTYWGANLK